MEVYEEIREIFEEDREKAAWTSLNRKARSAWAGENPSVLKRSGRETQALTGVS
jgi:hypothetical protein